MIAVQAHLVRRRCPTCGAKVQPGQLYRFTTMVWCGLYFKSL
jgi:hypothetical protein